MRVTDRLWRTGDAAVAVVPGGSAAACSIAAVQSAVSLRRARAVTGAAAPPADGTAVASCAATVHAVLSAAAPRQRAGLTITQAGQAPTVPLTLGTLPAT
ncbi:MAG: hypothetical protein J2P30_05935 [Actinobacteria bacterium]|nr:hypothetical protein [Actinomycetota bacterium]